MNLEGVKRVARQNYIKVGKARKNEIIRAIQQTEGNLSCFGSNISKYCGQKDCIWREDCA